MATDIHALAVVDARAELADGVSVGPFAMIGPRVKLGAGTRIHHQASVTGDTTMGEQCEVFPGAVIGGPPQDLKYRGGPSTLVIGNGTQIRECCTINTGTELGGGKTVIGSHCLLQAYTHIAHDCTLSDFVVISNGSQLAGHVWVGEHARIMGLAGIHQFVSVGKGGVVGGLAALSMDVPPYTLAAGHPAKIRNLNLEGLKRRGVPEEAIVALKKAFRLVFLREGTRFDAYGAIASEGLDSFEVVREFVASLRMTDRGRHGRALEAERVELPPEERDGRMGEVIRVFSSGDSGFQKGVEPS